MIQRERDASVARRADSEADTNAFVNVILYNRVHSNRDLLQMRVSVCRWMMMMMMIEEDESISPLNE